MCVSSICKLNASRVIIYIIHGSWTVEKCIIKDATSFTVAICSCTQLARSMIVSMIHF